MLPPLPDGRVRPAVLAPAGVLSSAATAVDPLDPDVVALAATRWERGREGCLSVPDLTGDVKPATPAGPARGPARVR